MTINTTIHLYVYHDSYARFSFPLSLSLTHTMSSLSSLSTLQRFKGNSFRSKGVEQATKQRKYSVWYSAPLPRPS